MFYALDNTLLALDNTFVALDNTFYVSDNTFLRWIDTRKTCYPTGIYFIQRECRIRVILRKYKLSNLNKRNPVHENVLFNANTRFPKWKTWYLMQQMFIQCDNVLSNARTCYPTWKGIIQCKKCAIQRNKRDIRQENRQRKIVITVKKI